tara:strand:- start:504 stop:1064 length:561 start_codon:yes stop_codon:yes gene_type:complete
MNIQFKKLAFSEIIVFQPLKFVDSRGYFFENFNKGKFEKQNGFSFDVIQENISFSKKNVLRGLHFQKGNHAQGKIITVYHGKILDVVVDIRPQSQNFGKWISYILDEESHESIFIPAGFAHGFLTLNNFNKISYKVDQFYDKESECVIAWNDKQLNINWNIKNPILSEKDQNALSFENNYKRNNFA